MKKILLIFLIFVLVFIIYYFNLDKKVYVLSIGDNYFFNDVYQKSIDNYLGDKLEKNVIFGNDGDYRIIDLLNNIKTNKKFIFKNKEYTLNNALIKADIIFLSIGINDLRFNRNNNYDYVDEVMKDLDELLRLIRRYSKEKIYIFNYYNVGNSNLNSYVNNKLSKLVIRYNINIIDISNIQGIDLDKIDYDNFSLKIKKIFKNFTN